VIYDPFLIGQNSATSLASRQQNWFIFISQHVRQHVHNMLPNVSALYTPLNNIFTNIAQVNMLPEMLAVCTLLSHTERIANRRARWCWSYTESTWPSKLSVP
jgi:hypothetical protein